MSYKRGDKYAKSYKVSEPGFTGGGNTAPGVRCKLRLNLSAIFAAQGNAEFKKDAEHARIVGDSERRTGNFLTATSQTSLLNTDNDAQQSLLHPSSARKWAITREHACRCKRLSRGGKSVRLMHGDQMFEVENTPTVEISSEHATSVGFVKREHRRSSESSDDYIVLAIRHRRETL